MSEAIEHFSRRLRFETDVSDVHSALSAGAASLVVVDSRGHQAWAQGHVPGAVHLPTADIAVRAGEVVPRDAEVVTYCWGPGCNGATRAALEFARLGYRVREMIGGFEYWVREGLEFETSQGTERRPADELTAPRWAVSCDC
jgi:rhodanese-related sulfurtransferase